VGCGKETRDRNTALVTLSQRSDERSSGLIFLLIARESLRSSGSGPGTNLVCHGGVGDDTNIVYVI
jgi:hypothetical protein